MVATRGPRRNIEIKCEAPDLSRTRALAERLGARDSGVLEQRDTFFEAPHARLKLREFPDGAAELIGYRRADAAEPRGSDYVIYRTGAPAELAAALSFAMGVAGVVEKRRHLFLHRNTRIHLDSVRGLGSFVELETVIAEQTDEEAFSELREVAAALELRPEAMIAEPYVELLRRRADG